MSRRCTRSASPSTARANQRRGPDRPSDSLRPKSAAGDQILTDDLWDPWPGGDFDRLFTWEEVTKTDSLREHWACQPGGDRRTTFYDLILLCFRSSLIVLTWVSVMRRHILV
ncbi:hypothetical protein BDR03DRAFT_735462 [Suillus americanus]|nr:hypothetical protein BDR03DRAFT_735462 [Suillus americanus]